MGAAQQADAAVHTTNHYYDNGGLPPAGALLASSLTGSAVLPASAPGRGHPPPALQLPRHPRVAARGTTTTRSADGATSADPSPPPPSPCAAAAGSGGGAARHQRLREALAVLMAGGDAARSSPPTYPAVPVAPAAQGGGGPAAAAAAAGPSRPPHPSSMSSLMPPLGVAAGVASAPVAVASVPPAGSHGRAPSPLRRFAYAATAAPPPPPPPASTCAAAAAAVSMPFRQLSLTHMVEEERVHHPVPLVHHHGHLHGPLHGHLHGHGHLGHGSHGSLSDETLPGSLMMTTSLRSGGADFGVRVSAPEDAAGRRAGPAADTADADICMGHCAGGSGSHYYPASARGGPLATLTAAVGAHAEAAESAAASSPPAFRLSTGSDVSPQCSVHTYRSAETLS